MDISTISFIVYLVGTMLAYMLSEYWRENSLRSERLRAFTGGRPGLELLWMLLMIFTSWFGLGLMLYDLRPSLTEQQDPTPERTW